MASSSIDGGDSGGPCYSDDRALIGIMVSSTTTSPRLKTEYERTIVEEEIADASASPADTWISPGNLILEAYQVIYFETYKFTYNIFRSISCSMAFYNLEEKGS